MVDELNIPIPAMYFLEPGYVFVATKPMLIVTELGSSVAVCIYDRRRRTGGMNHFQIPYAGKKHDATAHFGNIATLALIRMMTDGGSKKENMEAQLLGGAYNPGICLETIGRENITVVRKILAKERIQVVSEDVGGRKGRKIIFSTHTNEIVILKVNKLERGKWYPYEDDC